MKSQRLIVEVGSGCQPWVHIQSQCRAHPKDNVPCRTAIMDAYADVRSGDRFLCLDSNPECIKMGIENMRGSKKEFGIVGPPPIEFVVADGRKLSLADGSADAVILQDVLSAPTPGTTPRSEPYPLDVCISSRTKWRMIEEALRVLKDGGALVIGIEQTPCYAKRIMARIQKELVAEKKVTLVRQCGTFVPNSDNWHLYHAVFQKEPGPAVTSAEITPWTPAQKRYIKRYAASWLRYW